MQSGRSRHARGVRAVALSGLVAVATAGCGLLQSTPVAGPAVPEAPSVPEIPPPPELPEASETPIEGAAWVVDGHPAPIIDVQRVAGGRIAFLSPWADVGLLEPSGEVADRPILDASGWLASELDASPDGTMLAAATNHGGETWDVETGLRFGALGTFAGVVAWSPDGARIATSLRPAGGGREGFIGLMVWDARYGTLLHSVPSEGGAYVDAAAWSPDGSRIAVLAGEFFVYDVELGQVTWRAEAAGEYDDPLLWHPGASTVALVSGSMVTLFDVDARERTSWTMDEPMTTGRWSDAEHLALVAEGGDVLELDVATGETSVVGRVPAFTLAFEPLGEGLAAIGTRTGRVGLWDVPGGREEGLAAPLPGRGEAIAFRSDGERIASGGDNGVLRIWDSSDGTMRGERVLGERPVDAVAWSPDDRRIAVAHSYRIELLDAATLELLATASGPYTRTLAFGPEGTLLTEGGAILDGTTLEEVGPSSGVGASAVWGPGGATLAVGSAEGDVELVDAATGELIRTVPTELDRIASLAWSSDGATLAAADYGTIVVVDAETGSTRFSVGYVGPLASLMFTPDAAHVVTITWPSAFDDGLFETVRFWDPVSGEVRFGVGGTSTAGGAALDPDGGRIALANWSGKVAVVDLPVGGVATALP